MTADFARIEQIFTAAVSKLDPVERAVYLNEACAGDAELRQRLEDLLAADADGATFLPLPNDGTTATFTPLSERPGTVIGRYKLLEQIGEGGFGVVFMAEQEQPVRRRVALKIIKAGMDTRQVVARFEAERQALAMMDHPNIARVFDGGATDTGRPYFVMELVRGVPITEYCDEARLSTSERLALFQSVCSALQHAHQKGIIHRDLKPSNVLVTMHDDKAVPKVIDFGVAKATQGRLTERTLFTEFRAMIGTPNYMSPEQAHMSGLDVDTRSDVYSLGVLLYELLTGTTPIDTKQVAHATYDDLRRMICEVEPPRPSARLSTLTAERRTTLARQRHCEPAQLAVSLRSELDWIVMKCLEKDRSRRYESASALAGDLERYLSNEPVEACPPSAAYRFRKFAQRNKTMLAAGGAIAAALVIGLGISTWMFVRERTAAKVAKANETRATTEAGKAKAVSDLLQQMLASSNPDQVKGAKYTVRELLDDFSSGLGDQLTGEPQVEAAIRSVIGKSYWRLGVYDRAELHSKKALDLQRQLLGAGDNRVADTLVDYAWSLTEQRRFAEAETAVRDALSIYRTDDSDPRGTVRALWTLQEILHRQYRYAEAEVVANDALAIASDEKESDYSELPNILHTLSDSKLGEGKYAEAEEYARQALRIHRRLHGDHHHETAMGLWILGSALRGQRKFAEAEPPLREALAIFREHYSPERREIQGVTGDLTLVLTARGNRAGLDALFREQAEQAVRSDGPGYHIRLAEILLSNNPPSDAQRDEARRLIRRAVDECAQVAIDSPDNLDRRVKAAEGFVELISICAATPGFANEVDELNPRLSAEMQQISLVARRLTNPAASIDALYYVALMHLRLGDEAGYRATCKTLFNVPVGNLVYATKLRTVWTACLAPKALEDLNLPVTRANGLVENDSVSRRHFSQAMLGAALYRAGQYEQAAERLEQSSAAYHSNPPLFFYDVITYQRLLFAMTRWKLGQKREAQRLLHETLPAVEKELQSPAILWNRRVSLELLRDEATQLIEHRSGYQSARDEGATHDP